MTMLEGVKTTVDEEVIKEKCKEYLDKASGLNPMANENVAKEMAKDVIDLVNKVKK